MKRTKIWHGTMSLIDAHGTEHRDVRGARGDTSREVWQALTAFIHPDSIYSVPFSGEGYWVSRDQGVLLKVSAITEGETS